MSQMLKSIWKESGDNVHIDLCEDYCKAFCLLVICQLFFEQFRKKPKKNKDLLKRKT